MKNVSMRVLVAATGVICALGMVAGCGGKDSADAAASTGNAAQSAEDYNIQFAQCLRDKIGARPLELHPHAGRLHLGIKQQSLQRAPHVRERPSLSGFRNRKAECRHHDDGVAHHD